MDIGLLDLVTGGNRAPVNIPAKLEHNIKNVNDVSYCLEKWVVGELDQAIFRNRVEATSFYNKVLFELTKFNSADEIIRIAIGKKESNLADLKFLVEKLTIIEQNDIKLKYLESLTKNSPVNMKSSLAIFDRFYLLVKEKQNIENELIAKMLNYNNKVDEITRFRTIDHYLILEHSFIRSILSNQRTRLQDIFNFIDMKRIPF